MAGGEGGKGKWYGEIVFSLALTVLYTWLYRGTGSNRFLVGLFHALSNSAAFTLHGMEGAVASYPFVVGVAALSAAGVVLAYGPRRFGRGGRG